MSKVNVWANVGPRAQATDDGPLSGITSALGKTAEKGVQAAVSDYLNGKGDQRVRDLVSRVNLVLSVTGIALSIYLITKSGKKS